MYSTYRPIMIKPLSTKQLYQVTHSLYPEDCILRRFPCGCNLNTAICNFIVALRWGEETERENTSKLQPKDSNKSPKKSSPKSPQKSPQSHQKVPKVIKRSSKSSTGPQQVHSYTCIHSESRCKWGVLKGKVIHFHFF